MPTYCSCNQKFKVLSKAQPRPWSRADVASDLQTCHAHIWERRRGAVTKAVAGWAGAPLHHVTHIHTNTHTHTRGHMRTHETHRRPSFTALPSHLLYSQCLQHLYLQRRLLLMMLMSCLPITNDGAQAVTCTKAHKQHSTTWHSMQMEQHGSESAVSRAVADTTSLIEVEVERRV